VLLQGAAALPYDHLILAPGARNRELVLPGWQGPGVVGVRTLRDADFLRERLPGARHVAVIGAGFIGLEFAAVAAAARTPVEVVELGQLPMGRALTPATARHFQEHHTRAGIRFHMGRGVTRILRDAHQQPCGLVLTDGSEVAADLVVYGIGVVPNVELAQAARLACDNGILVDAELRTDDPHISAIGDAVNFARPDGQRLRLESVQNAVDQAKHVSQRIVKGVRAPYRALPWFWSDQGALRLQIAGLATGHDATHVIGDPASNKFSVLCFAAGRLVSVESVNQPADHMAARRILAGATSLLLEDVQRPDFSLKAWDAARTTAGSSAAVP
jgi:3-phenylpropionate/trans-cinnamate dioxygenase ferredoxin reductase subunit